jgi:hypothetical protein
MAADPSTRFNELAVEVGAAEIDLEEVRNVFDRELIVRSLAGSMSAA